MSGNINNNINEDYCSFQISKLLKEKGFDVHCDSYYEADNSLHQFVGNYNSEDQKPYLNHFSRPTHALAIKWIRENFGIHIYNEVVGSKSFRPKAYELEGDKFGIWEGFKYKTPEEATESALLYTLQNLIK